MRFSFFSHIQDLATSQLVLTSPFKGDDKHPSRCCYELHHAGPDVLEPDPAWSGMAAYHRLLPMAQADIESLNQIPIVTSKETHHIELAGDLFAIEAVVPHTGLPHLISLNQASASGYSKLYAPALGVEDADFIKQNLSPELSLVISPTWSKALEPRHQFLFSENDPHLQNATALGPWHHPFRLEGMKLAALELYNHCFETPTILLRDPSGEWVFAFLEAAKIIRQCEPGSLPFRLILLEEKPFDRLCRAFEGRPFENHLLEKNPPAAYRPLPELVAEQIITGVMDLAGTVIACEENAQNFPGSSIPQTALETLARTGFIDEEDQLIFLQPYHSPTMPNTSGGSR